MLTKKIIKKTSKDKNCIGISILENYLYNNRFYLFNIVSEEILNSNSDINPFFFLRYYSTLQTSEQKNLSKKKIFEELEKILDEINIQDVKLKKFYLNDLENISKIKDEEILCEIDSNGFIKETFEVFMCCMNNDDIIIMLKCVLNLCKKKIIPEFVDFVKHKQSLMDDEQVLEYINLFKKELVLPFTKRIMISEVLDCIRLPLYFRIGSFKKTYLDMIPDLIGSALFFAI